MTTKHTPGPWIAAPEEVDRPYVRIRGTELGTRFKIANGLTPIYDGVHPREVEETRANASLIAAATANSRPRHQKHGCQPNVPYMAGND